MHIRIDLCIVLQFPKKRCYTDLALSVIDNVTPDGYVLTPLFQY